MSAIQFELERLYDLTSETRKELDEATMAKDKAQNELDEAKTEIEKLKETIKFLEQNNYALNHRLDCLVDVNRLNYRYIDKLEKENDNLKHKRNMETTNMRYGKRADMFTLRMPPLE